MPGEIQEDDHGKSGPCPGGVPPREASLWVRGLANQPLGPNAQAVSQVSLGFLQSEAHGPVAKMPLIDLQVEGTTPARAEGSQGLGGGETVMGTTDYGDPVRRGEGLPY